MYEIYIDGEKIPILPDKLKESNKKDNKTYNILSKGEVVKPGKVKLRTWSYKSVFYSHSGKPVRYYKNFLDRLLQSDEPFRLIINRYNVDGSMVFDTNSLVIIESIDYEEEEGQVGDLIYSIKFVEYKEFKARIV